MQNLKLEEKLIIEIVELGYIDKNKAKEILNLRKKSSLGIGKLLLKNNILTQKEFIRIVQEKLGIAYANLNIFIVDPNIVRLIPKNIALEFKLIPLLKIHNVLSVAMLDPFDMSVIKNLEESTGLTIKPLISTETEITQAISFYYDYWKNSNKGKGLDGLEIFDKEARLAREIEESFHELSSEKPAGDDKTISRIVNIIIMKAIYVKASDIHIEPEQSTLRVRFRIDGILHEVMSLPDDIKENLVSRIKILAEMDIAEKRIPQDGHFAIKRAGKNVDIRVSTYPSVLGEKVVMRILDKSATLISLEDTGFNHKNLIRFKELIHKPNGIILVTGPTGSGKTSTLYAALMEINSMDRNIVTIEDPVEYHIPSITQAQVLPKAGFDFAVGLRAILRQDPDVIMVGEIRDLETAETAIRAALTGHLVFSSLHTNDAAGAVTRLVDMGVEPFLVASSIIGVLAQRLVRRICPYCKYKIKPSKILVSQLGLSGNEYFYEGKGCEQCNFTGYLGRTGIFEFLIPNDDIRKLIIYKEASATIKKQAIKLGMQSLRENGLEKARKGITTLDEVIRVTYA